MDLKAKKILQTTFWSSKGWKSAPASYTGEDFEYAKSKGVMFDNLTITHDELVQRLEKLHQGAITKERVVAAFLHSLSTRKVHLRSALSSWALTSRLGLHTYEQHPLERAGYSCCGDCNAGKIMSNKNYMNEDLNVLNFERIKWGGIRLNQLLYCWFDLELLSREEELQVSSADWALLDTIIKAVRECDVKDTPRKLEKRWKDLFPANQHERDVIMEIWGYAGLLVPQEEPRQGRGGDGDFNSVANWRGDDGVSEQMLEFYFGNRV
ncbi:hypothetical protein GCM10010912_53340 [Paenibacillus albidus]|uniref:Uncharacterized protein n=1 Tax=Paenibacillus albidus TaxID=2041023 RepID=A0A917CYN2_9BACL|nr:hypothetical protein [Paenibacillus albidus]GGG01837.1 hypothetical protein GCM10010912_53340 [Paenibacillus albidus]